MATTREKIRTNLARRKNQTLIDPEGGAGSRLAGVLGLDAGGVNSALRRMEQDGEIERHVEGRRTYSIKLLTSEDALTPSASAPIPPAHANGAVVTADEIQVIEKILLDRKVMADEIESLKKKLAKAEDTIAAQQLDIAALKRQADKSTTEVAATIDKVLIALEDARRKL